jgi:hypothetical protein
VHRFEQWRDAIQAAADEHAVGRVIREYVEVIPKAVSTALPPECKKALADWDVQSAAITLLHCELSYQGDSAVGELLHEIAHTYAAASMRIARLSKEFASGEGGPPAARRSA